MSSDATTGVVWRLEMQHGTLAVFKLHAAAAIDALVIAVEPGLEPACKDTLDKVAVRRRKGDGFACFQ